MPFRDKRGKKNPNKKKPQTTKPDNEEAKNISENTSILSRNVFKFQAFYATAF